VSRRAWPIAALVVLAAQTSQAQETAEPPSAPPVLPPVVVTAPPPVAASSEVLIPGRDFELRPQGRPADVVRLIPGFVISQHQGVARRSSISSGASTPTTAPTSRSSSTGCP